MLLAYKQSTLCCRQYHNHTVHIAYDMSKRICLKVKLRDLIFLFDSGRKMLQSMKSPSETPASEAYEISASPSGKWTIIESLISCITRIPPKFNYLIYFIHCLTLLWFERLLRRITVKSGCKTSICSTGRKLKQIVLGDSPIAEMYEISTSPSGMHQNFLNSIKVHERNPS